MNYKPISDLQDTSKNQENIVCIIFSVFYEWKKRILYLHIMKFSLRVLEAILHQQEVTTYSFYTSSPNFMKTKKEVLIGSQPQAIVELHTYISVVLEMLFIF